MRRQHGVASVWGVSNSANPVESSAHGAPFVYHLLALHHARRTGVLTVRADGVTTDLYLREGTPVFADRNTLAGSLARTLLADGVLTEAQYEAVIARMTEELFESEQMRFAEVAMTLGFVSHEQVHTRLEQQVKSAVIACMEPLAPLVTFRPEEAVGHVANYPCRVQPMVLAGVKAYYDLGRTQVVWRPDARAFAELCLPADETAALYALQPAERRYIGNIDGSKSIEDLIHTGFLDVLHASQVIVALLLTEGVRLYKQHRAERESLRPARPAVIESDSARRRMSSPLLRAVQVPAAPAVPSVAITQDAPATSTPPPVAPPAAAPLVPASPVPPATSVPEPAAVRTQSMLQAEQLFMEGKRLYRSGNQARALKAFSAAVARDPVSPEYALYERWARFLVQPPQRAEDVLQELSKLALDTIRRDKANGFAFYVHGRVAHARGSLETAKQSLKTAVKLDPGNLEAKTFLRALTKR